MVSIRLLCRRQPTAHPALSLSVCLYLYRKKHVDKYLTFFFANSDFICLLHTHFPCLCMSLSLHIFPSVLLSDLKALRSRSKVIQKRKGTMSSACSGQQLSGLTKENFMNATMNKMKDAGILSVSTSIHIFMHTHICFFSCSVSCSKGCISVAVA